MRRLITLGFIAALLVSTSASAATVVDVLGRAVEVDLPADKVVLGEGRFITALGVLGVANPVGRVAGMLNEFRLYDPNGFNAYRATYPEIDQVPTFGQASEDSVSIEKIIALNPDVAIFGVEGHGPKAKSKLIIETLEAAGIPVVFIDFRQKPLENTAKSIELIGRLLGQEEQAREFAELYRTEVEQIKQRLQMTESCPTVLLEIRVGLSDECCMSISRGLLADLIEAAGGCNIAREVLPGVSGLLNLEYVITSGPEVYIGTAVGTAKGPMSGKGRIILGAGVDPETAQTSLRSALDRDGIGSLPAVEQGRAHGIWHHFYNSPLNLYAYQVFAKWLHPELFEDMDPEKTLNRMLQHFEPVNLAGTYSTSLD